MSGKYYKNPPKPRQRHRRALILITFTISLGIFSLGAIYSIDKTIRYNMLPNAPALLDFKYSPQSGYSLELFGKSYDLNFFDSLYTNFSNAIKAPGTLERLFVISKALILRENLQPYPSLENNKPIFS